MSDTERLVVLDTFEGVLGAAPLLADLLSACPGLTLLVTSRARLRLSPEHCLEVPPLPLPDPTCDDVSPSTLGRLESVHLFQVRARAVNPAFELTTENAAAVSDICRRLDGLPLAIELAAARSNLLAPPALLARLERRLPLLTGGARDQPARQRTMRDTIAWSHGLLAPDEQTLFRRLAAFVGSFTVDAAAAVSCLEASQDEGLVLDGLGVLIDQSLIGRLARPDAEGDDPRFVMLETIREYADERLEASGEAEATRRRHALWFMSTAERTEAAIFAGDPGENLNQVEADHANLRAAQGWATTRGEAEIGLRLACALWLFWARRNHRAEGRHWFERALERGGDAPEALRAKALLGVGGLAGDLGDAERATAVGEESLALYRALGDALGVARAQHLLGAAALMRGDVDHAIECLDAAAAGYVNDDDRLWRALALGLLGLACYGRGDRARAAASLAEAMAIRRALGDRWPNLFPLPTLGQVACDLGDMTTAAAWYRRQIPLWQAEGNVRDLADALAGMACVAASEGAMEGAARLAGAAEALGESAPAPPGPYGQATLARAVAAAQVALGDSAFAAARAAGRGLPLADAVAEATALALPAGDGAGRSGGPRTPANHPAGRLSPREREVLRLVAAGRTGREIADALSIGTRTVEWHVANILTKLDLDSRAAAAAFAVRHGIA